MGNHDYKLGDLTSQFVYPHPRWIMPNKYYFQRFNSGMICVWFIDTTFFFDDSDQIPWLINSLENESEECHWKLMAGHRPVYSAGEYATTDGTLAYQPVITDIISKYGIHMYFSGHEHNSQVLFKDGVYYLIAGAICELRSGSLTTDNEYYSNNLIWGNDKKLPVIMSIDIQPEFIQYDFIHVGTKKSKILYSGRTTITRS